MLHPGGLSSLATVDCMGTGCTRDECCMGMTCAVNSGVNYVHNSSGFPASICGPGMSLKRDPDFSNMNC